MGAFVTIAFMVLIGFLFFTWLHRPNKKLIFLLPIMILLTSCGINQVDEGFRGIKTNWGKVLNDPLVPGLYFYNPISQDIFEMDVKERKLESEEACFTKDTQTVSVRMVVTIYPDPLKIALIYSQFGHDWEDKVVKPVISGVVKDVIGQYVADDLVHKRDMARSESFSHLKETLSQRNVIATRLDFVNLDFNDAYEHAVEAKVVAVQRAAEAKNKTVQVSEEAQQKVLSARADAEAMRIKTQALTQNKGLVEYEAIQKWDGKLPEIMFGNSVPIINLDSLKRK